MIGFGAKSNGRNGSRLLVGSYTNEIFSAAASSAAAAVTVQPLSIQAIRVIGNRDSKRYHLPGMIYFDKVDAHHRVEFQSEEEAVKAGYRKAPK